MDGWSDGVEGGGEVDGWNEIKNKPVPLRRALSGAMTWALDEKSDCVSVRVGYICEKHRDIYHGGGGGDRGGGDSKREGIALRQHIGFTFYIGPINQRGSFF